MVNLTNYLNWKNPTIRTPQLLINAIFNDKKKNSNIILDTVSFYLTTRGKKNLPF